MNAKNQNRFIYSVAVILFVMAASQLFATLKIPSLLDTSDTLLGLSLRHTFYLIAAFELALSAYLLTGSNPGVKLGSIIWLIVNLTVYQIGLRWSNLPDYLNCLGNLSDDFPVPPRILSWILLFIFAYCFVGSCAFLILAWLNNRKHAQNPATIDSIKEEQIQTAKAYGN